MRSCSSQLSNKNVLSSFRNESKLKDGLSRRSVGALRRPYILQLRDYGFEPRTHRQQVIRQKYIHRIY